MASAMCRKCSKNLVAMSSYTWLCCAELECDAHEVERIHRHPARAVRLIDVTAGRQRCAAIEDADVVETEEAALEDVAALGVLAIHPPGEVQQQLVEHALEELQVAFVAALLAIDLEHAPGCPRMHRRIHVAERPLVGGHLAVRMHVPLAREQHELLLGELGVDERERDRVEREIPRRVPRVFPLVGHRDDVGVVEMRPLPVAPVRAICAAAAACVSDRPSAIAARRS